MAPFRIKKRKQLKTKTARVGVAMRVKMLPVTIFKEGDTFVAYSPVLDLSSCGQTFEQAQSHFGEVVGIFLKECLEKGTLVDVLASLGWTKAPKGESGWIPPQVVAQTEVPVPAFI